MTAKSLVSLFSRVNATAPPMEDVCAWMLLRRAWEETRLARDPQVFEAKALSLLLLVEFGWRDVFKESLTTDGRFKSREEAGRFAFCASWAD